MTFLGHVKVLTKSIYLLSFDLCTRKTFKSTGNWEKAIILRFCFEKNPIIVLNCGGTLAR